MYISGILLSHKRNKSESLELRWMNLDPVIQSEVSQKEKNKYCILTHIYVIQKNGTDQPICMTGIEMQMQRMNFWTQQGKKRLGRIEKVALKHTLPYENQIANGKLLYNTGSSSWCSVITQRRGMGKEVEGSSRGRGHMYTHGRFMLMYTKNHHNIVK